MTAATATSDQLAEMFGMPKLTLACFLEALLIEKSYREAAAELGTKWPGGRCVEASIDLRDVLQTTLPRAGAVFVFGKFTYNAPKDDDKVVEGPMWEHAWVALRDGTIIDLTASQFLPEQDEESTVVIPPDHSIYPCYLEDEREPRWAR